MFYVEIERNCWPDEGGCNYIIGPFGTRQDANDWLDAHGWPENRRRTIAMEPDALGRTEVSHSAYVDKMCAPDDVQPDGLPNDFTDAEQAEMDRQVELDATAETERAEMDADAAIESFYCDSETSR